MKARIERLKLRSGEVGAAMVVTLLVMAVLTGLGAVVFNIGFNNLQNAGRDRLAGGAMGASEGGVAQALSFVRTEGVGTLKCTQPPQPAGDCSLPWGKGNPKIVSLANGRQFSVWIERIQPFAPPDFKVGTFEVHSRGCIGLPAECAAGSGRGLRNVDLRFTVTPLTFPIGVYADEGFTDAGGASVSTESLLSKRCISGRKFVNFSGQDPYHKIPAAAHSVDVIVAAPNSCNANDSIHVQPDPGDCNPGPADNPYKNDQDRLGGNLVTSSDTDKLQCLGAAGAYPQTSKFDLNALYAFGYQEGQPRGLSTAEYAQLKGKAQEQNYFSTSTDKCGPGQSPPICWRDPVPADDPNAIMYWDLRAAPANKKTLPLPSSGLPGYDRTQCGSRSLILVVEGGNMQNSGINIVGAIFVPDGSYQGNGNSDILGTLFAKVVEKFNGTANFTLTGDPPGKTNCFFDNFPGGLLDVRAKRFREVDR